MIPLLSLSWLLPLVGAALLLFVGNADGRRDGTIRWITLIVSLVTFAVTLAIWAGFDSASAELHRFRLGNRPAVFVIETAARFAAKIQ